MIEHPYRSFADFHARSDLSRFPHVHRACGSEDIKLIKTERSASEVLLPAVPELIVGVVLEGDIPFRFDLGDGWSIDHRLRKGDIRLCLPNTEARYECLDDYSLLLICLPLSMVDDVLQLEPSAHLSDFESLHAQAAFRDDRVRALALGIWSESSHAEAASNLMADGLAQMLVAQLLRRATPGAPPKAAGTWPIALDGSVSATAQINRARDYIEAHLAGSLSVAQIAAEAATSPGHFSRVFKAATGEPVWAYVQRRRCERARELLEHTSQSIAGIAYACGFSSQAHFTHCFRQAFGVTPGALRRN